MENIRKMFSGEVIVIDDEVDDDASDIYKIKEYLKSQRFPVKSFDSIPNACELKNLKIAFIICDWKFGDRGEELNAQSVIEFLNEVTKDRLLPVFICTTLDKSYIDSYLSDTNNGCKKYKQNEASCIFIVKKEEIKEEKMFEFINSWLNNNPAVTTMKEWEHSIDCAKEKMFSDLYNESEYWPLVLHQSFKEDGEDVDEAMGEFLTRNLFSRAYGTYSFKTFPGLEQKNIDISSVLDGERTLYYDNENIEDETKLFTGDIFEFNDNYFINIKRQCDLLRNNNNVYLLKLESAGKMSDSPIKLADDKRSLTIIGKKYDIATKSANDINDKLVSAFEKTNSFHNGKFLEKSFEVIIPCVCHFEVCKIDLRSLNVVAIETLKQTYKRKARLLEPYISIVTEKFASYISSKGAMRTPDALLTHKLIIKDDF